MNNQIFISYRHQGGEAMAFLLKERFLQERGWAVFFDRDSLGNGRYDKKIFSAIANSRIFLLILSMGALDACEDENDWVYKEVKQAMETNRTIIPVMMDGFVWPDVLPKEIDCLRNINGVAFSFNDFIGSFELLCSRIDDQGSDESEDVRGSAGEQRILVWTDFDLDEQELAKRLDLPSEMSVCRMNSVLEFFWYRRNTVSAVVLLDTDVTKFASNDRAIDYLNKELVAYVKNGGRLIVSHDTIYRRTRNKGLQDLFGCVLDDYKKENDKIPYVKSECCRTHGWFASLPDRFSLTDREVCFANSYARNADVFFSTGEGKPLVFGRRYGKGYCIWMNSGEYSYDEPPPSIADFEDPFVAILRHALMDDFGGSRS